MKVTGTAPGSGVGAAGLQPASKAPTSPTAATDLRTGPGRRSGSLIRVRTLPCPPMTQPTSPTPDAEATIAVEGPYDLVRTLGPLTHGRGDPTIRIEAGRVQRATRTPDGPVAADLAVLGEVARVRAWGPGAAWAVD